MKPVKYDTEDPASITLTEGIVDHRLAVPKSELPVIIAQNAIVIVPERLKDILVG